MHDDAQASAGFVLPSSHEDSAGPFAPSHRVCTRQGSDAGGGIGREIVCEKHRLAP